MKKIETNQDREKKERKNKIILGVILGLVMLFGTAGYSFLSMERTSSSEKVKYNGLEFVKQGEYWQTSIQNYNFYFSYLPNETSEINIKKTLQDYANKPLYFANNGEAGQEILRNLQYFVLRVQEACLLSENCSENLPVKNCSDNIIIIKEKESLASPVLEEDNCIYIISNNTINSADSFLYKILGIK